MKEDAEQSLYEELCDTCQYYEKKHSLSIAQIVGVMELLKSAIAMVGIKESEKDS